MEEKLEIIKKELLNRWNVTVHKGDDYNECDAFHIKFIVNENSENSEVVYFGKYGGIDNYSRNRFDENELDFYEECEFYNICLTAYQLIAYKEFLGVAEDFKGDYTRNFKKLNLTA